MQGVTQVQRPCRLRCAHSSLQMHPQQAGLELQGVLSCIDNGYTCSLHLPLLPALRQCLCARAGRRCNKAPNGQGARPYTPNNPSMSATLSVLGQKHASASFRHGQVSCHASCEGQYGGCIQHHSEVAGFWDAAPLTAHMGRVRGSGILRLGNFACDVHHLSRSWRVLTRDGELPSQPAAPARLFVRLAQPAAGSESVQSTGSSFSVPQGHY